MHIYWVVIILVLVLFEAGRKNSNEIKIGIFTIDKGKRTMERQQKNSSNNYQQKSL